MARKQRRPARPKQPAHTARAARVNVPVDHLTPHTDTMPTAPHATLAGSRALDLTASATGPGLLDAILEVVGGDTLTLRQTLALWQREQDRLTNRARRHPGGLARPAGL